MVLQYDLDVIADRSPFIAGQTFKRRLELGPHAQQLGGTFGALAVMPINGNLVGATAPAPELQKVYYYNRVARRQYRRAYRRGYYGGYAYNPGYYGAYNPGYYGAYNPGYYGAYNPGYYGGYRRYW